MANYGHFLSFASLPLPLHFSEKLKLNIEQSKYKFILSKGFTISLVACLLTFRRVL